LFKEFSLMSHAEEPMDLGLFGAEDAEAGLDPLLMALAKAADLCLKPYRHALRFSGEPPSTIGDCSDCVVLIEARTAGGERSPERDLELEIYRSGDDLHLMLSLVSDEHAPLLWHGSHPVWMQASSGERCDRPSEGAALEALCRRIRALLVDVDERAS
jgi:hypothetical protein